MTIEVRVPALPESVSDGVIVAWHKQPGDAIVRDEALVDIETDKVVLEVPAPNDGVLDSILINSGDTVTADQVIGVGPQRLLGRAARRGAGDQSRIPVAESFQRALQAVAFRRLDELQAADFVIENVPEDPALKQQLFARLAGGAADA